MKIKGILLFCIILIAATAEAQFTNYKWGGSPFASSGSQARRFTIGRAYYSVGNWGLYGNIKFKVYSYYFKSGYSEYLVQANAGNNGVNDVVLTCTASAGLLSSYGRIVLSSPVSAGYDNDGWPINYRDIYLDADYYSQWFVEADVTAGVFAFDKSSISSSEYSYVTLFTSPSVQNISSFYTAEQKAVSVPTDNASFFIKNKVGIGTDAPTDHLHIQGADAGIRLSGTTRGKINIATTNQPGWHIEVSDATGNQAAGDLGFTETGVSGGRLVLQKGGNVGIGTTNPTERLSVNGNIRAKKLIITQANWPDYVFHPTYRLRPLKEVEQFIKQNSHLPEMPSVKDVDEKGLDMGATQAALLKKVEELTLYMISLQKQNDILQQRVNKLEGKKTTGKTRR